jgi:hypothetical protein
MADMTDELAEAELIQIEQRTARAFDVAPSPWLPWLETRGGIGGSSFISFGGTPESDNEMYVSVHVGARQLISPDPRLDAIVDFLAHTAEDVPRLLAEVRRLRRRQE